MKKILMVALAALFTVSVMAQTPKIGHVNFNELVQLMPEADAARSQIAAASKEAQDTYTSMAAEFQTKAQQYQQKQSTWTPAVRQSKETELNDIQQRIQQFEQSIQQELAAQQQKLMAPIYEKATKTVKQIAKSKGLTVVFESTSVLYLDEATTVDITADARKALNIPADRTLESLQAEIQASLAAQQGQQK